MKAELVKISGRKITLEDYGSGHALVEGSFGINENKTILLNYFDNKAR